MANTIKFFLFTCLLFWGQQLFSYNVPTPRDTNKTHILDDLATRAPYPYEYKVSRQTFLVRYSFDKQSAQLINTFFNKQKQSIWFIVSPTLIYFLMAFFYIIFLVSISSGGGTIAALLFALSIIAWFISWGFRILGIINLAQHKKIDLLFELINYRKNSRKGNSFFNNEDDYYRKK